MQFLLMPTISERQILIEGVLLDANERLSYYTAVDLDREPEDQSDHDHDTSKSSSSSPSDSSFSSDTMSSETSTSSSSSSSSEGPGSISVDDLETDEEHAAGMAVTADHLQVISATWVLSPHDVAKCSQLNLILINFKQDDPKCFRYNL